MGHKVWGLHRAVAVTTFSYYGHGLFGSLPSWGTGITFREEVADNGCGERPTISVNIKAFKGWQTPN